MICNHHKILKSIASIGIVAMLFSCINNSNDVKALFETQNLPIGVAKNVFLKYRDSGRTTSKLFAPILKDYSNRKDHPYSEYPKGIEIISFKNRGNDSITISGDYALTYTKTKISELKGNVIVTNHKDTTQLRTDQLFWDENTNYFFSENKFKLTSPDKTVYGVGFESKKDLSEFLAKRLSEDILTSEN